jgi:hypothetical protein
MDWYAFLKNLMQKGYDRPFVIENEADNSSHTGNRAATIQGFKAAVLCLAPIVWPLDPQAGYQFDHSRSAPLKMVNTQDIPVKTMKDLI